MTLDDAIAELRRVTPNYSPWTGEEFSKEQPQYDPTPTDNAIAVVLNAVLDGALIREAEARGYNNGMLTAISVVAEERNKRNPGPLFEVLNKTLGKIDDARFAALRGEKEPK